MSLIRPMKICIPTFLTTSQKAGIAFYTINLIDALQKVDSENEYYLLTYEGNKEMFDIYKPNFHKIVVPFREKNRLQLRLFIFYYHAFILRRVLKKYKIDLVHIPSTWFVSKSLRTVITIHDIVEFKSNRYSKAFSTIKKSMVKSALANAKNIVTVSEYSKKDLCSIGAKPEKVHVTYNGVNAAAKSVIADRLVETVLKKYKLINKKYFLFIGTAQLHKNIPRLISAFDKFNKEYPDFRLVLAGKKDNARESIARSIQEMSAGENVIQLDYISDEEKDVLIKEAAAFVFVSLHEGFGMPILEANRYKTPLIVSNVSSLPEVAAGTALYVDPLNVNDIYEKMKVIVENPKTINKLVNSAEGNLIRFDWLTTAEKTIDIYKKALL